jgi:hypothetical protein
MDVENLKEQSGLPSSFLDSKGGFWLTKQGTSQIQESNGSSRI